MGSMFKVHGSWFMVHGPRPRAQRPKTGFTLIELLAVLSLIAILGVVAIPTYIGYRDRARDEVAKADCSTIRIGEGDYARDHHEYTGVKADLQGHLHGTVIVVHGWMQSLVYGQLTDIQLKGIFGAGGMVDQYEVLCAHPEGNRSYCGTEIRLCSIVAPGGGAAAAAGCCVHDPAQDCAAVLCIEP